jgi:hypothetical protein
LLALASAVACAGCAGEDIQDGAVGPVEGAGAIEGVEPAESEGTVVADEIDPNLLGTFRNDSVSLGRLVLLTLKSDGTFHSGQVIACVKGMECGPAQDDGYYQLTRRVNEKRLELFNMKGVSRGLYKYERYGDTIRIRRSDSNDWYSLVRSDEAWCKGSRDCQLQNLYGARCAGGWACQANACQYQCDSGSSCEVSGGACLDGASCEREAPGSAGQSSCEGNQAVSLPPAPTCGMVGTSQEGWYDAQGARLCSVKCEGASARCGKEKGGYEGWYAVMGMGCNGGLIKPADCSLE